MTALGRLLLRFGFSKTSAIIGALGSPVASIVLLVRGQPGPAAGFLALAAWSTIGWISIDRAQSNPRAHR